MKLEFQAGETKVSYAGNNWRKAGWQGQCVRISKAKHKDERGKGVGYTASATILHHYPTPY